jgi:hypothetical protein
LTPRTVAWASWLLTASPDLLEAAHDVWEQGPGAGRVWFHLVPTNIPIPVRCAVGAARPTNDHSSPRQDLRKVCFFYFQAFPYLHPFNGQFRCLDS